MNSKEIHRMLDILEVTNSPVNQIHVEAQTVDYNVIGRFMSKADDAIDRTRDWLFRVGDDYKNANYIITIR